MRYILFVVLFQSLLFSSASIFDWAQKGYKNFRTYPRINRAYKLIEANRTKEAKELLQKALDIDSQNQKAIDMMLNLCISLKDSRCVDRYIDKAKNVNLGYVYKHKAHRAKENQEYKKAIKFGKKALSYKLKDDDRYFVKLIIFDSYLKLKEYQKADDFIDRDRLITYQLYKWSRVSDNLGDTLYAYELASELPNKIEYLKWQIELLLKDKRYKEASKKMEILYKIEPTTKNKKQLLYLYSLTKQKDNIIKVYKAKLAKGCDEYALNFLLDYYKDDKEKRAEILEKEYPYSCLPKSKRVNLSLELIERLKNKKPKKAKRISKEIMPHIKSEKKLLTLYQLTNKKSKMVKIYQNRLKNGCNRYALLYLLDFYKKDTQKYKELLEKHYPYSCLPKEAQVNLSLELAYLLIDKNPNRAKIVLDSLDISDIDPSRYLDISNMEAKLKDYKKSIEYALAYLKKNPNDIEAIKHIGYLYFKMNQKELSAHYLIRASKLDPKDRDLLKNIGYLCVELGQYDTAVYYWKLYLDRGFDAKIALELASLYYYHLKDYQKAQELLSRYEKSTKIYTAQYYQLKAKLAYLKQNCKLALNNYKKAVEKDESLSYEYAHLLQQCKEEDRAIEVMKKLSKKTPNNIRYKKELAYMYEKKKDYSKAIEHFKDVAKAKPTQKDTHLALAYTYKKAGKLKKAKEEFKKAIDSSLDMDKKELKAIKSEISSIDKRLNIYISQKARLDGDKKGKSPSAINNNSTYNGFGSIELSYQPRFLPKSFTLFANVLHDHQNIKKSAQPSVGVRYKPLKKKEFFISARRLLKGGKNSREDTLLQASLGISSKNQSNIYQNLYLDSGYFTKADSIIAYGNYEVGKEYSINKNLKISPYITTGGTFSNDNLKKESVTNLDVGLGVAMDIIPNESRYELPSYRNRLKLEAREKYGGNAKDKNAIRLQWEFFY